MNAAITLADIVQLYVPLVGLIGMAYWTGVLSQRVRSLESTQDGEKKDGERLARVETLIEVQSGEIQALRASIDGLNRQLSNLMTGRAGAVFELTPTTISAP